MSNIIVHGARASKGIVKRSPREEMALRVRMLNGRHLADIHQRVKDELGKRANEIGPIDLTRNPLRSYVSRVGRAYLVPPLAADLSADLALTIGDQSATTTVARYAAASGRPLPTRLAAVSTEALRYRLGCNYVGTLVGWSDRSRRPYLEVVTPDDLDVEYLSDDPIAPTVIRHRRRRLVEGEPTDVSEVYDLTNPAVPSYRVFAGKDVDVTKKVHGRTFTGDDYWWRYDDGDGRPFHRIVISGDAREVYRGIELVEGSLRVPALWTHWAAGVRDAGHPQRNVLGMEPVGMDSDEESGSQGMPAGPENVVQWVNTHGDRNGEHWQFGPGFDPEVIGKAVRSYELGLQSLLGVPVDFESTGGEPTEQERKAVEELIRATFTECRIHDGLVLKRVAAVINRASAATDGMDATNHPERALGVLYRDEIAEALGNITTGEE